MNTAENIETNDTMSAIDIAIAKAKARAAARNGAEPSEPRAKVSPEEREASRAAAKAERERLRSEKAASKRTGPVHMKKVERAASRLPSLDQTSASLFNNATSNLSSEQITALALHLQHHNRVQATQKAISSEPLKVGQVVRITGGDARFIGATGHLERVQRIRCYVKLAGSEKLVYCFTSDVSRLDDPHEEVPMTTGVDTPVDEVAEG